MRDLRLGKDLHVPIELVTKRSAYLGLTGTGKTYAATKAAELMLEARAQIVAFDPVGKWHGLRQPGLGAGFDIPVFGGLYGDLPLEPSSGALIAEVIVEHGTSAVLDVSLMLKPDANRFARDFAIRFFDMKKRAPSAVHLFLEECQEFIPEDEGKDEKQMLGAFTRVTKIGRNFGIGLSFISQRPQEVSKRCLNLSEMVFAFQINGTHERKAIKTWLSAAGLAPVLADELPTLKEGECFAWSPSWLGVMKKMRFDKKRSADVSATPEVGKRGKAQKSLPPIDLDTLRVRMTESIERARAENPKELRKRITMLERELVAAKKSTPEPITLPPERIEVPTVHPEAMERIGYIVERSRKLVTFAADGIKYAEMHHRDMVEFLEEAEGTLERMSKVTEAQPAYHKGATIPRSKDRAARADADERARVTERGRTERYRDRERPPARTNGKHVPEVITTGTTGRVLDVPHSDLKSGQRTILIACAQHDGGCNRAQLKTITGYATSTINRLIQELKALGMVEESGKQVVATDAGVAALGSDYEPLPTGDALLEYWLKTLPQGNATVLRLVADAYPGAIEREMIDKEASYATSTRNRLIQELSARKLVEAVGPGKVRASHELFD